jgi:gamma-glutamylaminecyclotransferase
MIPVFVYGSLRSGAWNHFILKDSFFLGGGVTEERFLQGATGYPVILKGGRMCDQYRVKGELYEVSEEVLSDLDKLEGHPTFYRREQRQIMFGDGKSRLAWVYIGNPLFWANRNYKLQRPVEVQEAFWKGLAFDWKAPSYT